MTLSAVGICASEVLYMFEWLAVSRMDHVGAAFGLYDKDGSGSLDLEEFRAALNDLGITPTDSEFQVRCQIERIFVKIWAAFWADFG